MAPSGKRRVKSEKSKAKKTDSKPLVSTKKTNSKVNAGDSVPAKRKKIVKASDTDDRIEHSKLSAKFQKQLASTVDDSHKKRKKRTINSSIKQENSSNCENDQNKISENGTSSLQSSYIKSENAMGIDESTNLSSVAKKGKSNVPRKEKKLNSTTSKSLQLEENEKKLSKVNSSSAKTSSIKKSLKETASREIGSKKTTNAGNSIPKPTTSKGKPSVAQSEVSIQNGSSDSEEEWEEVPDNELDDDPEPSLDDYKPELPEGGVDITLGQPNLNKRRERKAFDMMDFIRLQVNRVKKENQLAVHQVHLLCLIAHGQHVNNVLNSDEVKAYSLSLLPSDFFTVMKKKSSLDLDVIEDFVNWFTGVFRVVERIKPPSRYIRSSILRAFESRTASNVSEYNLLFVGIARTLGMNARLCMSLYPISYKPTNLLKKQKDNESKIVKEETDSQSPTQNCSPSISKNTNSSEVNKSSKKRKSCKKSKVRPKIIKFADDSIGKPEKITALQTNRPKRGNKKASYVASSEDSDSDDDFIPKKERKPSIGQSSIEKKCPVKKKDKKVPIFFKGTPAKGNRKILSSDSDSYDVEKGVENWIEVYSKMKEKWVCIECNNKIINKPYDIESVATQPISYVLAFDSKSRVKDVTKRYCSRWMTHTRKLRVETDWWEDTLDPFLPPNDKLNKTENSQLEIALLTKPMPKSISEFKNHPLYALKRHLLKFEAIYPPDALTVGFIRGEAVYSRDCVHTLHSRETWLKEARMVRIGEEPYKIVKARPKWDKYAKIVKTDLPLDVFGHWQTEKYMPPIAHGGKVPRNEYGNVELFKQCMLPIGTVHLRIPCLNRFAKKLNIDCSPAVVGFDGHRGSIHAVFDGFIVCEEFKDTLLAAWDEEQEIAKKRAEEKRSKRIYGNWKKLIKGLLIRERIKTRYLSKN